MATYYKIIRLFQDDAFASEVIDTGLTLAQAQAHCRDESTHGEGWFDAYEAMTIHTIEEGHELTLQRSEVREYTATADDDGNVSFNDAPGTGLVIRYGSMANVYCSECGVLDSSAELWSHGISDEWAEA